jgi:putative hemolysin
MTRKFLALILVCYLPIVMAACQTAAPTPQPDANLPNPASAFCEEQGYTVEIVTAADGSQTGECVFPDGSRCDEWVFFRGECAPGLQPGDEDETADAAAIPTPLPVNLEDAAEWVTYTHPVHGFTFRLPGDWLVAEDNAADSLLSGHLLILRPADAPEAESIRLTFRVVGEDTLLWPTGVGEGEFIEQGRLEIAGEPVVRRLLVCPSGEVSAVYYQPEQGGPNILRGGLEFAIIYTASPAHCTANASLGGAALQTGETIIASLEVK